ncbi:hypothetical protein [Lapidilactobacillus gannanensis]|jgi:hypothetical protein|uniref:Uncharacterized protein n=1 Tax=Lapidilactobacillus gannanensis TaxID=2486002 RepID=A0ABW4BN60_9LACO|nr:hypothetical protein [Lapidilactobacillus gannanensis]
MSHRIIIRNKNHFEQISFQVTPQNLPVIKQLRDRLNQEITRIETAIPPDQQLKCQQRDD